MQVAFARIDAWMPALVLAVLMILAWLIGLRARRRFPKGAEPLENLLDEAALALVGLLLAFTFAMAIGKHDQRRTLFVADTNAIGDFYTCASLLPEPTRAKLQGVIREYAEMRLAAGLRPEGEEDFERLLQQSERLHAEMTALVSQAVNAGTPVAVPLVNTLNNLTSSHAARIAAHRDRLPVSILGLLFIAAAVSAALLGRQPAATSGARVSLWAYILIVTLVVYVILDLNQPHRGLITVSQEPLERLIATMGK